METFAVDIKKYVSNLKHKHPIAFSIFLYRVINVDVLPNCVIQNCSVLETAIQKQPARNSDLVSIARERVWRQGSESSIRTTDLNIFHLILLLNSEQSCEHLPIGS